MNVLVGLVILAVISVLLGRVTFEPESDSVRAATRPVPHNFIWQLALLASGVLMLVSQLENFEVATRWVYMLASGGFIAFALICLARSIIRWQGPSGR